MSARVRERRFRQRILAVMTYTLWGCFAEIAAAAPSGAAKAGPLYAGVLGGDLRSVLPTGTQSTRVRVAPFALQRTPVTNREFLAFVRAHPEWQRGRVGPDLADERYLQSWQGPLEPGPAARPEQPVTEVSWFAARAFCESRAARLPSWSEWEFASAADERVPDARRNPAWQERILAWYSRPSTQPLPAVGEQAPNFYGIQDLHGLVWEWVEDFNSLFISADNRDQGDPDLLKFCGSGALSVEDRENYPVMMRLAMLSSLKANSTTVNVGFRCARDASSHPAAAADPVRVKLETQSGQRIEFPQVRGRVRIVTMFYASCPFACPLTIDTLRSIERQLSPAVRTQLDVLMITLDPEHDTRTALQKVALERRIDSTRWMLARTAPADVRKLSAILDIPYRKLDNGSFNHATVLVLMDAHGRMLARTSRTGLPDPAFLSAVRKALEPVKG